MKIQGRKEIFEGRRVDGDRGSVAYPDFAKRLPLAGGVNAWLNAYWRFFLAGLTRHGQTGALIPSQRFLIDQMIAPVPSDYGEEIVELGAGTGVLTFRLATSRPAVRILSCEINTSLARDLQLRLNIAGLLDRVKVTSDSAEHLLKMMCEKPLQKRPDFVISGIPLGNLGREKAAQMIEAVHRALKPGGMYIQFQHSVLDRKTIKTRFSRLRTLPVLLNLPPAFIYFAWK